jgi:bifunctional DNase/RNase
VDIVDYNPQWPTIFEHLRDQLHAALGSLALCSAIAAPLGLVPPCSAVRMVTSGAQVSRGESVMTVATDTGLVPMRVSKAVGLKDDDVFEFMVLDELDGDRQLVIQVGHAEAFGLAASLQGLQWGRPMTYQFTAALVHGLGGRVRGVRVDRVVEGAYAATVEVEGPQGVAQVDARSSDALNLAVLTDAPVFVALNVLADCIGRQAGDSAEAGRLRLALTAGPMTIGRPDRPEDLRE